jgi:hypothetical protein
MKLTKEQYADYQTSLHMARNDASGIALTMLLEHEIERVKDLLVNTHVGEVPALQGEAQAYRRLLKVLKEPRRASTSEV